MATVLFTALFDEVLPDVPGVPQNVALNAIRNTVIEFCERSKIWVVDHAPIDVMVNVPEYAFIPPAGTIVAGVMKAWYNSKGIDPTTSRDLSADFMDWKTKTGTPYQYLQESTDQIILFPIPAATLLGGLALSVALKPARASTGVDGWIIEQYQEELAHGAKARLFAIQKKPWSSPELAVFHGNLFEDAVAKATLKASKGLGRAKLRSVARFF